VSCLISLWSDSIYSKSDREERWDRKDEGWYSSEPSSWIVRGEK